MSDEATTTNVESELPEDSITQDFNAGDVDDAAKKSWQALLDNDGKLPDEKSETAEGKAALDETKKPDESKVALDETDKHEELDSRLARLEKDGAAEIEAARQAREEAQRAAEANRVAPPKAPEKIAAEIKAFEMPDTIRFQGQDRKVDEILESLYPDEDDLAAAKANKDILMGLADAIASKRLETAGYVRPDAIAPIQEQLAHQEAMILHHAAVMEVALLNPEIIAIDARRPGNKNPHPFWDFINKQSAGIKHKILEVGRAEDVADAIGAYQDLEKLKADADRKKTESKTRKDLLYETGPSNTGGKGGVIREMTDEEFEALPEKEKRRAWSQMVARTS